MVWPNKRLAAIAIIDDTDDAVMPFIKEVYDVLIGAGIRSTKTVWVYPPRDPHLFRGDALTSSKEYLEFIRYLSDLGFEIGLHNVGSGGFQRQEIIDGLNLFRDFLGYYPETHVNHSYNKDNIYSGDRRFVFPLNYLLKILYPAYTGFEGHDKSSAYFWGDVHKKYIKWSRSFEIMGFDLSRKIRFPYREKRFSEFCNMFFPSVFASNQDIFCNIVSKKNLELLVRNGGCSIIYTHFGYFCERGGLDRRFIETVETMKEFRNDIWFTPVKDLLSHLCTEQEVEDIGYFSNMRLQLECLWTRIWYRYIRKLDDFHYKASIGQTHRRMAKE